MNAGLAMSYLEFQLRDNIESTSLVGLLSCSIVTVHCTSNTCKAFGVCEVQLGIYSTPSNSRKQSSSWSSLYLYLNQLTNFQGSLEWNPCSQGTKYCIVLLHRTGICFLCLPTHSIPDTVMHFLSPGPHSVPTGTCSLCLVVHNVVLPQPIYSSKEGPQASFQHKVTLIGHLQRAWI